MSPWTRRLITNICVIGGPLAAGLAAVADQLPPWVVICVVVASVAIKQYQSSLDLKAPAK